MGRSRVDGKTGAKGVAVGVNTTANFVYTAPSLPPPPDAFDPTKYRDGQPLLFQAIRSARTDPRFTDTLDPTPGGQQMWLANEPWSQTSQGYTLGVNLSPADQRVGATSIYIDQTTGWKWSNLGGDVLYLPTAGVYTTYTRNTAPINVTTMHPWHKQSSACAATVAGNYTIGITQLLQFIQTNDRWNAMLLQRESGGTARGISTRFMGSPPTPPTISVVYDDASVATLSCISIWPVVSAFTAASSTSPILSTLPCFMEFERPVRAVTSATLNFRIEAGTATAPVYGVWPLDPPRNTNTVETGIAYSATYDADLAVGGPVLWYQSIVDGSVNADFIDVADNAGDKHYDEAYWDPALWDRGPTDTSKYPHTIANKWFNVGPNSGFPNSEMDVVPSTYTGAGFVPLMPGVGALRIRKHIDANWPATNGCVLTQKLTNDSHYNFVAYCTLPADAWGSDHIFNRYYVFLGNPQNETINDRRNFHNGGDGNVWTNNGGKHGMMAHVGSTFGQGFSGASGGGAGFQLRQSWGAITQNDDGPDTNGISLGLHTVDWNNHCPPGYGMGGLDGSQQNYDQWRFGQIGGRGGILYTRRWYCIEFEYKLNTVRDEDGNPIGPLGTSGDSVTDPTSNRGLGGFLPDGYMRMWIDGVKCWERQNIVFRTLPMWYGFQVNTGAYAGYASPWHATNATFVTDPGYVPGQMRPTLDLGFKDFLINFYHGGQTPDPLEREWFISQPVIATSYIGPMRTNSPVWLEAAGNPLNTWVEIPNSRMATDMVDFSIQYTQGLSTAPTITSYNVGDVFVTDPGYPLNPETLG